jgi:hypothetical protein
LFLIQPIVAKEMLPWLGGGAAVWGTCMVFFQSLLLIGYLYAHASIRWLGTRAQALLHLVLLATGAATLFFPPSHPSDFAVAHPISASLQFLVLRIGLPYLVLSSTTPMVQAWYSRIHTGALPYRLFALSNLSSLLALAAYPFAVEPALDLDWQIKLWRWAYAAFAVFCAWIALRAAGHNARSKAWVQQRSTSVANWRGRLRWLALAWCSSALLLGVTNNLCQNIAPMPLMWIAPLAIYLLTFVLCFDREGWFRPAVYRLVVPCALVGLVWVDANADLRAYAAIPVSLAGLFVACMFCHGQLAALKPAASDLTSFYLFLSLGGALGGVFVGLAAPVLFHDLFEMRIAIAVCIVLTLRFLFDYRSKAFLAAAAVITIVLFRFLLGVSDRAPLFEGRNFYGALAVKESVDVDGQTVREMVHGRVAHGGQMLSPADRQEPRYYYGRESGIGRTLTRPGANRRVGIVGLGAGTIAAYGRPGDDYRFYEINQLVADSAYAYFSYLRDSRARVSVAQGDARLTLDAETPQHFDALALDAFSGDSVPVHLLTQEAFRGYLRHLSPDGILAVHVSSRYLDLAPVVAVTTASLGMQAVLVDSPDRPKQHVLHAIWVLASRDSTFLDELRRAGRAEPIRAGRIQPWTDRYSNILAAMR